MPLNKVFVRNLKRVMKDRTAYNLAKEAGVHPSTVQRLLNGELENPSIKLVEQLSKAVGVAPGLMLV